MLLILLFMNLTSNIKLTLPAKNTGKYGKKNLFSHTMIFIWNLMRSDRLRNSLCADEHILDWFNG